ncbi:MAG TPA: hypothetical protein VF147_05885 [Vicinamibacterales bacterium]
MYRDFSRRAAACALFLAPLIAGAPAFAQTPSSPSAAAPSAAAPSAAAPSSAAGTQQTPADPQQIKQELDRLRQEFEAIRDSYGARLAALEAKLAGTPPPATPETPAPVATPPAAVPPPAATPPTGGETPVPQGAAGAGGPEGALPVYGNTSALSKVFNPDMAAIGNFVGATGKNSVDPLPAFNMQEAELTFQAIVDPYARADFFLTATPDGVELEEGFLTLTSLPGGLLAKVGKFKEQFGKVNTLHPHVMPWVDEPLVMKNLLGGEEGLNDSGVSVSKLIMNPWFFLEATGELYQGNSGPFASHERSDVSWLGRVRAYRDITEGTNLDLGFSFTQGHNDVAATTKTKLFGIDATVRYRPLRRAIYRRFIARTELMWSRRGQLDADDIPAFGMYASGEYQFARRWFGGVRFDSAERAWDASLKDTSGSLILTYWPSEFSQIRGQFRRTKYGEGVTANEALFQFLFSIGAHGAHVF